MAAKKPKTLTDAQLKQLSDKLIDTSQNVYRLSESMFGQTITEEEWERLEKIAGIFRCEECNQWIGEDLKCDPEICVCCDCDNARNEDD